MGKLTTSITDPDQLAMHLLSGDVITEVELDGIINSEHSSVQKTCKLMRLVLDKIKRRPEVFCHFTEVLREANMSSSVEILQGWSNVWSSCFLSCMYTNLNWLCIPVLLLCGRLVVACHYILFYCLGNVSKESPLNQAQELDDSCQVSISPAAEPYIRHLREVCRSRPVLEREKSPIMTCKKFINLAAIKKEQVTHSKADDFTKATLQGNIDVIRKSKEPVEMEDIFEVNEGEKLKCVLVQGAPGVGKSTFAWELCCNWEFFDKMKRFKIVKLVELRHSYAHEARSIEDLLQVDGTVDGAHSPSEHAIQATAKCITDSDGEGLLLVLDGFDELPHELQTCDDSLYVKLLTNRYLPNCTVVITSRTCAARAIENTCARTHSLSKNVEILGFLPQDIEEYVNHFFPDADMRDKFKTYMESNPLIKSMMYIPLNTAIVTTLYKEKSQIQKRTPMTMTQLYSDLSVHLILCYMTKMNMEYNPRIMIDEGSFSERLKYLPKSVVDSVKQLAKVAFEGLYTCSQQLIFRGRTIPDEFESMGFMNKAENTMFGITVEPTYNFLHLTVQEFLAAFHISMLPKDEQLKVLKHMSTLPDAEQDHFNVVWRFLAGMTSFQSFGWDTFVKFRFAGVPQINPESDVKMCSSLLLNCLYEAQDETACKQIYPGGYVNYSPISATMYDYYALGYCISKTPCVWKLCSISGGGLAIIATGIKCSCTARNPHPTGRIELIKLSHEGNKIHDLNKFPECIKENIKELNLSNCGLDNRACNSLATLLHQFRQLESLHLGDNPFTEGGSGRLFRELSKLGSFHQLDLLHSQLGSDDIDGLSTIIRPNGTLTSLVVGNSDMSVDIVESLVNVILQDSCLRTLSIMNIDLVCLAKHLSEDLKRNNTLSMLMLWDCSYCIDGCITVARALETNSSLQSLTLMPWYKHQIPSSIFSAMDSSRISWFFYPQNK